jgi:hypothetical protein
LTIAVVFTFLFLGSRGFSYYITGLEERFFHPDYAFLKPGGPGGHGFGILGSLSMILGVGIYMTRKRVRALSRFGLLSHWLQFHIFLCTLGPVLVLYHTSFKFGGLVAVSFWSMVVVFLSGILGRFIYLQIPRTIEGRELSLAEVKELRTGLGNRVKEEFGLDEESRKIIEDAALKGTGSAPGGFFGTIARKYGEDLRNLRRVKHVVNRSGLTRGEKKKLVGMVRQEMSLNRRIDRLVQMQNLFRHWHVAHLPFAFIMLIIMLIHVIVTVVLGYHWIF